MTQEYSKCLESTAKIREVYTGSPQLGIILGTGLGGFADGVKDALKIPYAEIPNFPRSTVSGHSGRFVIGSINGVETIIMQGRVHLYEGYSPAEVIRPIRVMKLLGISALLLTNAAGGINPDFKPSDLMRITDHIGLAPNPLTGANTEFGTRFPDCTGIYNGVLSEAVEKAAKKLKIPIKHGVYLQTPGPSFETPAEIRFFGRIGADAVGMSTAAEAIAARHAGLDVAGISLISNYAAGLSDSPLSHEEVGVTADSASVKFIALLNETLMSFRPKRSGAEKS